jgi:hypothetical protein
VKCEKFNYLKRNRSEMRLLLCVFLVALTFCSVAQQKKTQILVIGTFHFNNPGLDVNKVPDYDVLSDKSQKDLEFICNKIKDFHPTNFFVEWPYEEQNELDSLYKLYLGGSYFTSLNKERKGYKYYSRNEIFQLAFRASAKANILKVTGVDYQNAQFPFDSLMSAIKGAKQTDLLEWQKKDDEKVEDSSYRNESIIQKLLNLNTELYRKSNRSWYITFANRGGDLTTFVGAYLASEWFKRNLYMYSQVQKNTKPADERVVLLLGAGHTSMIETFIKDDDKFELVELKDIIK